MPFLSPNQQFSSVQFANINVVPTAKHFRTTTPLISVIDAVVAGKEMSSGVAEMRTKMVCVRLDLVPRRRGRCRLRALAALVVNSVPPLSPVPGKTLNKGALKERVASYPFYTNSVNHTRRGRGSVCPRLNQRCRQCSLADNILRYRPLRKQVVVVLGNEAGVYATQLKLRVPGEIIEELYVGAETHDLCHMHAQDVS